MKIDKGIPEDIRLILDKMKSVINTTSEQNDIADRWLSLANYTINRNLDNKKDNEHTWGIIGACMGLNRAYKNKFGYFWEKPDAIINGKKSIKVGN